MQSDILFDNIYIGHSVEDAEKLAEETFKVKQPIEKALADADKPKMEDAPKSPHDLKFLDDPVHYAKEKLDLFMTIAQKDPIQAIKFVPDAALGIAAVLLSLLAVVASLVFGGSAAPPKPAQKGKEKEKDEKDKAAEATTTGAEKSKGEATKRTTRSQS